MHPTDIDPASNESRLVEEAIRRLKRALPDAERHDSTLRTLLFSELDRGRRDMFSLIRAGRRAIELG